MIETFAAVAVTLYAAHHVGDYWVQTDAMAAGKGKAGAEGRGHCLRHVATYLTTQVVLLAVAAQALSMDLSLLGVVLGLAVSGVTHWMADRREHGLMFKLARRLGKGGFMKLGVPREPITLSGSGRVITDNPSLGTGAWALDQSWHIFWGVFVAGLIVATFSS